MNSTQHNNQQTAPRVPYARCAQSIARFLDEKKAENIIILNVHTISDITDYFVFATGTSTTHVASLCDALRKECGVLGMKPLRAERCDDTRWAVLDYGTVIVHIFLDDVREHYQIEQLWADASVVAWKEKQRERTNSNNSRRSVARAPRKPQKSV